MSPRNLIQERLTDERAVSPVIGVILMVAITVILAAVIGTFVLDLGQSAGQSAPQASLSVSASAGDDTIEVEHTGGDAIDAANTRIIVEWGTTAVTFNSASSSATLSVGGSVTIDVTGASPSIDGAFSSMTTSDSGGDITSGDQVTVTLIDTESQRMIFETTVTA